jgi:hypothetical protein
LIANCVDTDPAGTVTDDGTVNAGESLVTAATVLVETVLLSVSVHEPVSPACRARGTQVRLFNWAVVVVVADGVRAPPIPLTVNADPETEAPTVFVIPTATLVFNDGAVRLTTATTPAVIVVVPPESTQE